MSVRRFEDLLCWQLSDELKKRVYAVTDRRAARSDFKFCQQIRASARSAPANIAEGFARFRPRDFARFLEIARGSLTETRAHLLDAVDLRYITQEEYQEVSHLAGRAGKAITSLILYLKSCP